MLALRSRTTKLLTLIACLSLPHAACKLGGDDEDKKKKEDDEGGDDKAPKADDKGEAAEDEGAEGLQVAVGDEGAEGPVPPESSMVLFSIEGALVPLACFDKDGGGKLKTGEACLAMVKEGDMVRLDAGLGNARNKAAGPRMVPLCMQGEKKTNAIQIEGIADANYKFAAFPPSTAKAVKPVDGASLEGTALMVDDDTKAKIFAAMKKDRGSVKGEVEMHQVAEVDVDGNPTKEVFYSAYIKHPKVLEQYLWSGIFMAKDGNIDDLVLMEKSKKGKEVFEVRAALDLDGAGTNELWMRNQYADGGGDAVYTVGPDGAKRLGKWSCGA